MFKRLVPVASKELEGKAKASSPFKTCNKNKAPPLEGSSKKRKSIIQALVESKKSNVEYFIILELISFSLTILTFYQYVHSPCLWISNKRYVISSNEDCSVFPLPS